MAKGNHQRYGTRPEMGVGGLQLKGTGDMLTYSKEMNWREKEKKNATQTRAKKEKLVIIVDTQRRSQSQGKKEKIKLKWKNASPPKRRPQAVIKVRMKSTRVPGYHHHCFGKT